jgi:sphingomyelin phosphodiesterase
MPLSPPSRAFASGSAYASLVSFLFNFTYTHLLCFSLAIPQASDPDVCAGIIAREGPILAHDLRQISSTGQTAEKLCDALLGMCVTHPINEFTVPFPKPLPKHPKAFKSRGRPTVRVAHLSDVHIDRMYTVRLFLSHFFFSSAASEPSSGL